ncbi:MAG: biosynthetic-type acetolactate synthase large subunit [Treponema sp.]|nr:biosynthetic-type acetolactate synthase large subunit [Treponema sp.]
MKQTGAQIITKLLEMHGIKTVAGIPGGSILPLYDELTRSKIHHVLVRQEQASGFLAQGMARTTGLPAVCMVTSGPGAMNLLTAIADARSDSIPVIAFTGQVNTKLLGTDAFQEADTFGLSFPITKHSVMVKKPEELLTAIPEAFKIAMSGRPGPVLIDVPRDVQLAECEFDKWPEVIPPAQRKPELPKFATSGKALDDKLLAAAKMLSASVNPIFYLGGGANSPKAAEALKNFMDVCRIPSVTSLMGIGSVPSSCKDFMGMIGMHGTYAANYAMHESDVVIACGVRFDDRATGLVSEFCPNANIIHIDVDAAEINKILPSAISIVGSVESILPKITALLAKENLGQNKAEKDAWCDQLIQIKKETVSITCGSPKAGDKNNNFEGSVNPRSFISSIPELAEKAGTKKDDLLISTDVGQHQMWTAQYYPIEKPRTLLTSGSLGTMGFGLPAAIGAAIANPEKRVICFSGDGSIMMNIQELATLCENNLPVTVIVFENGTLGMVYQQQKILFNKTYSASVFDRSPDLLKIAEGFGIEALDADKDPDWYKKAFDPNRINKPCFVRVRVDPEENVLPFVPGGKANISCIMN